MKRLLALILLLALNACATLTPQDAKPAHPLILISIDAFRADYYDRGLTPNLKALADGGARGTMRPSFPSLTFPNHYTLVTGKTPDHHGMVANYMYDPTHPADPNDPKAAWFDKSKAGDGFWWREAKPLWVSAEQAGLKAGIDFWPGGGAEIDHTRAAYFAPFTKDSNPAAQVDQLLAWMDLPEAQRPRLYLMYMYEVDEEGHHHGPDSPEVNAALGKVDAALGRLRDGLAARHVEANVVIVSDHGMIDVSPARTTYISDLLGRDAVPADARADPRYDIVYYGSMAMLNPKPGFEDLIDRVLVKTSHEHMTCWHKADIPARYRFGHNHRVPEILCLAEPGWQVGALNSVGTDVGNHGYDPAIPEMRAIFVANGPDIRPGVIVPVFDNVDVYSLETDLLHLKPESGDGSLRALKPALAH